MALERGGLLLRHFVERDGGHERLAFVPVEIVKRVTTLTALTPVPGAKPPAFGLALADGAVVTVLWVGPIPRRPSSEPAVVCQVALDGAAPFDVALSGGSVIATGLFEPSSDGSDGVVWKETPVPLFDVAGFAASVARAGADGSLA